MVLEPTTELARFTANLTYEALPVRVRERVKDLLLDAIACALAGVRGDEAAQIRTLARSLGEGRSTVVGGESLSLPGAVLLNGYLITAVTACDVHRPTLFHVTPEVVPPALAVAEERDSSGQQLITALAAGLEVSVRTALGTNYPAFRARGWHSPGVLGPFGGAAAAGVLMGLDELRQRNAFALAGSQSAGTFAQWGTPTIKFHQSRGALSGLLAALLGETGFIAAKEILTNEDGGIYHAYSDGGNVDLAVGGLGERWELENISLRLWPLASSIQSIVTAIFDLIERYDLTPAQVKRVHIGLSDGVYRMHGTMGWEDRFRALLSAPYAAAVVLHDRLCWLEQFSPERISDPQLADFIRQRVVVENDPAVEGTGAVVQIETTTGEVHVDRRVAPKGDPSDPLTRDQIEAKFRVASREALSPSACNRVLALIGNLENGSARELIATLGVARPTPAA
jgi:2-methylcitrate dehydratase PrpD